MNLSLIDKFFLLLSYMLSLDFSLQQIFSDLFTPLLHNYIFSLLQVVTFKVFLQGLGKCFAFQKDVFPNIRKGVALHCWLWFGCLTSSVLQLCSLSKVTTGVECDSTEDISIFATVSLLFVKSSTFLNSMFMYFYLSFAALERPVTKCDST